MELNDIFIFQQVIIMTEQQKFILISDYLQQKNRMEGMVLLFLIY